MSKRWILLRGLGRGNFHWMGFPDLLKASGLELELWELPGNGTRNLETTPLYPREMIENLRARSQFLREGKPVNICAISLGGMIALKWLEDFPQDFQQAIIINSSLPQLSGPFERLLPAAWPGLLLSAVGQSITQREKRALQVTVNSPQVREQCLRPFTEFAKQYPLKGSTLARQLILANQIFIHKLPQNKVTLVGSVEDHMVSIKCSEAIAREFKLEIRYHDSGGHDLTLDAPEWVRDLLLEKSSK